MQELILNFHEGCYVEDTAWSCDLYSMLMKIPTTVFRLQNILQLLLLLFEISWLEHVQGEGDEILACFEWHGYGSSC